MEVSNRSFFTQAGLPLFFCGGCLFWLCICLGSDTPSALGASGFLGILLSGTICWCMRNHSKLQCLVYALGIFSLSVTISILGWNSESVGAVVAVGVTGTLGIASTLYGVMLSWDECIRMCAQHRKPRLLLPGLLLIIFACAPSVFAPATWIFHTMFAGAWVGLVYEMHNTAKLPFRSYAFIHACCIIAAGVVIAIGVTDTDAALMAMCLALIPVGFSLGNTESTTQLDTGAIAEQLCCLVAWALYFAFGGTDLRVAAATMFIAAFLSTLASCVYNCFCSERLSIQWLVPAILMPACLLVPAEPCVAAFWGVALASVVYIPMCLLKRAEITAQAIKDDIDAMLNGGSV